MPSSARRARASRTAASPLPSETIAVSIRGSLPMTPGRAPRPPAAQPLLAQPVDDDLVLLRILGVAPVLVVPRTAREVGALGAHAREGTLWYAVVVVVVVTPELLDGGELLGIEHLAAVRHVARIPLELRAHPVVHADVEVRQHQ